ncbi:NAD(P)H-hydrate epimerase [Kribbella sp. NPDC026596]|uniref:NAD(P)H-hydrate epimerase n=1 Tax=Kribbella sp. NPDC026596 TaxID=3155122 RepID=UPI0033D9C486
MSSWPAISADQMREVDRAMIEDFHIELVQMMENAGRSLADLAVDVYAPRRVVVLAGAGGNGGGGLVAARHLANRGLEVQVVLDRGADRLTGVPAHQLDILARMGIPISTGQPGPADLVVDALIGYSLVGDPTGAAAELIDWANGQSAPVLSLDTPSGLDVTTGEAARPCVRAATTLTLALPKTGLLDAPEVGRLYLADISVPPLLYRRMGIDAGDLFGDDQIVALCRHSSAS